MSRASHSSYAGLLVTLAGVAAVAVLAACPAVAEPIEVIVDQAKVMRIPRPADIVIIGNPAIADATIQDTQTLIITGHSFGTTNLIVLDAAGQAIANEQVTVAPQNDKVVTVYRRASRETLSCTPDCSPMLAVGDSPTSFDAVNAQILSRTSMSNGATSN